jgi:hypothetical protein
VVYRRSEATHIIDFLENLKHTTCFGRKGPLVGTNDKHTLKSYVYINTNSASLCTVRTEPFFCVHCPSKHVIKKSESILQKLLQENIHRRNTSSRLKITSLIVSPVSPSIVKQPLRLKTENYKSISFSFRKRIFFLF